MGLYIDEKPPCMDSDTMPPKQVGIQWTRVVAPNATVHPEPYLGARSVHYNNGTPTYGPGYPIVSLLSSIILPYLQIY